MMADREILVPQGHSKPIGTYSPGLAVHTGDDVRWVFVTGQVATDTDGNVVGVDDPAKQTDIVFERIRAVLAEAGGTLADVVSLVIYLAHLESDFAAVSSTRNRVLDGLAPSSTLVEVSRLAEPACRVEISATAVVTSGGV